MSGFAAQNYRNQVSLPGLAVESVSPTAYSRAAEFEASVSVLLCWTGRRMLPGDSPVRTCQRNVLSQNCARSGRDRQCSICTAADAAAWAPGCPRRAPAERRRCRRCRRCHRCQTTLMRHLPPILRLTPRRCPQPNRRPLPLQAPTPRQSAAAPSAGPRRRRRSGRRRRAAPRPRAPGCRRTRRPCWRTRLPPAYLRSAAPAATGITFILPLSLTSDLAS